MRGSPLKRLLYSKRSFLIMLKSDLISYGILQYVLKHDCNTMHTLKLLNMVVLGMWSFYEEVSFRHYLQHYSGTTHKNYRDSNMPMGSSTSLL